MRTFLAVVPLALLVFAALLMPSTSKAQDNKSGDYLKVTQVPREKIDAWLKGEVAKSDGNWDAGRYSFYVGFSTAGFGSDPVPAIAMRRLAFTLMNNSLAVGDKLTPFAFEMQVDKVGDTIPLTSDSDSRAKFVSEVPYTSTSGSHGGHDIERALDDILKKVPSDEAGSTIILLLNKDNSSQDPQGSNVPLFGEDNPLLKAAIKDGGFRTKLVRFDFPMRSETNPISVAITALFPKKLVSLPDAPGTPRYPTFDRSTWQPPDDAPAASETLPNKTATSAVPTSPHSAAVPAAPPAEKHGGILWWIWFLLALLVVGVILFMVIGKRSGVQRPLQPVAAAAPAAPKVETIPGSLRVTIGPDEQTITPLLKGSAWSLSRQADGIVKLVDTSGSASNAGTVPVPVTDPVPAPGTSLATLSFGEDRALHADADGGALFAELQGTAADRCDSRTLIVESGKRILCRVQPPDAASKTRFEIVYDTQAGKGSRV
jgi:hypothetical protein